jgi:hypothetical protein
LNVRAHVAWELPRGRDQPIRRNAGEMKGQRMASILKLLFADDLGQLASDPVHAFIADERHDPFQ